MNAKFKKWLEETYEEYVYFEYTKINEFIEFKIESVTDNIFHKHVKNKFIRFNGFYIPLEEQLDNDIFYFELITDSYGEYYIVFIKKDIDKKDLIKFLNKISNKELLRNIIKQFNIELSFLVEKLV